MKKGSWKDKGIWDNKITIHPSVREDTNYVLLELAKDMCIPKTQVLEILIKESPIFCKKFAELSEDGFFSI